MGDYYEYRYRILKSDGDTYRKARMTKPETRIKPEARMTNDETKNWPRRGPEVNAAN